MQNKAPTVTRVRAQQPRFMPKYLHTFPAMTPVCADIIDTANFFLLSFFSPQSYRFYIKSMPTVNCREIIL